MASVNNGGPENLYVFNPSNVPRERELVLAWVRGDHVWNPGLIIAIHDASNKSAPPLRAQVLQSKQVIVYIFFCDICLILMRVAGMGLPSSPRAVPSSRVAIHAQSGIPTAPNQG
jgi:hypothetical protein